MRSIRYTGLIVLLLIFLSLSAWAANPAPLPFVKGSWTLVLLPDTQHYSESYPEIFTRQTKWIADNKENRNIAFVLHEGDITNRSTPAEWENARKAMSLLDGVVPYALAPGNHDYNNGPIARETLLSQYFPVDKYRTLPTFGGVHERGKLGSSYHLFSAGGRDWIAIALETFPRDSALKWADKVLKTYSNRSGIIVTHAYLRDNNTRQDDTSSAEQKRSLYGGGGEDCEGLNDGEEMWQKLVSVNPNMAFVFCGHAVGDGAGRLTSTGASGNPVQQIFLNSQGLPEGGSGYLGLVEFLPDGKTIQFKTYSPYLDKYITDDDHQYKLELPPPPGT